MTRTCTTAEITPRDDATCCEAEECSETALLASVNPVGATEAQILCPTHRVEFLREVMN